jgi:hypothetical protein
MRYGNPSTKSKVDELVAQGARRSCSSRFTRNTPGATSATACDQFFRALMEHQVAAHRAHGGALFRASALYRGARAIGRESLCRAGKPPRRPGGQLSRRAEALPDGGRSLSLPVPEDDAPAEGTAGLGRHRDHHHLPEPVRPRGMAEALHGGRGRAPCRAGQEAHRRRARRPSVPTASRRWKRSTKRSAKASRKRAARSSPIFPASTTTTRISMRCPRSFRENLKGLGLGPGRAGGSLVMPPTRCSPGVLCRVVPPHARSRTRS